MILTRRRFMQAAAGTLFVAPAIVKAENIMKIMMPKDIEMLPYTGHFRVPDLRGHFAVDQKEMEIYPGREMTATEVLQRRAEVKKTWANRWGGHMNTEMARKKMQAGLVRNLNAKIEDEIYKEIGPKPYVGNEVSGVWMDEAQNIDMRYMIHQKTGEILATGEDVVGYIPCDGRELSAIEYPNLHQVLGNKYG